MIPAASTHNRETEGRALKHSLKERRKLLKRRQIDSREEVDLLHCLQSAHDLLAAGLGKTTCKEQARGAKHRRTDLKGGHEEFEYGMAVGVGIGRRFEDGVAGRGERRGKEEEENGECRRQGPFHRLAIPIE